jgi:uncharacterized membrane protein YdjX (TVP38/TMEM64 family)
VENTDRDTSGLKQGMCDEHGRGGGLFKLVITHDSGQHKSSCNASVAASVKARHRPIVVRASVLVTLFIMSLIWVLTLLRFIGSLEEQLPGEHAHTSFRIPKTLPELKAFKSTLEQLNAAFPMQLLVLYISVYLFIRAFMIPGSFVLNLLAGSLYPLSLALLLVTTVSLLGDYLNYLLSRYVFSSIVTWFAQRQLNSFSNMVSAHKDNLLLYMTFLRALAVIPGWFINLASPLVGVRTFVFLCSTFIGCLPVHLIIVNAGRTLYQLQSFRDIFSTANIIGLLACAVLPLGTIMIRYMIRRRENQIAAALPTSLPGAILSEFSHA